MKVVERNRIIRPSTRLDSSKSYKIDTKNIESGDQLKVNISHESKPFTKSYLFHGRDVCRRDSISFRVYDYGTHIEITWSGAEPIGQPSATSLREFAKRETKQVEIKEKSRKSSFEPLLTKNSRILVLGTLPGEESLKAGDYYANTRNRFWRILSFLAGLRVPPNYTEKIFLLEKLSISLWDVVHSSKRHGSMDHNIINEQPNKISELITNNPSIQLIAFNGFKAEILYDKWNKRISGITYMTLPSTSSANTGKSFIEIQDLWKSILH